MFRNATKKEMQWIDNGKPLGLVRINTSWQKEKTTRPFKRNGKREILSIGRVNYALLDQFIMSSMNDYYSKLSNIKNEKERNLKVVEYNELYQLWYLVNQAKQTRDIRLNSYYDDLVYRLYVLGYRNQDKDMKFL